MIPRQRGTISFFCGPVRSGKTFAIDEICQAENRIVRFDVTGELVNVQGWTHVYNSPAECFRLMKANPYFFRIAYHPAVDILEEFIWVSKAMWRINSEKVLVCDEFHEVCPVNSTGDWVRTILRYARHAHIELICASQRIADVNKLVTSGADTVVLFGTDEARDLDAIEDRWPKAEPLMNGLRRLQYNDVTKVTSQIPQAVVISRSQGTVNIYDFKTGGFVKKNSQKDLHEKDEEIAQQDREDSSIISDNPSDDLGDDEG